MSGTMKFDVQGALELRWAATDEAIIKHGQAFLTFEESRPASEQLKDLSPTFFTQQVDTARKAAAEAGLGEAERARAAERVRQADEQLRPLIDKIILHLKSRHADNLADLELYTLKTKAGARGVSVTKPNNAIARRAFCLAYVERESSLPAEQQISDPPLSQTDGHRHDSARESSRAEPRRPTAARSTSRTDRLPRRPCSMRCKRPPPSSSSPASAARSPSICSSGGMRLSPRPPLPPNRPNRRVHRHTDLTGGAR